MDASGAGTAAPRRPPWDPSLIATDVDEATQVALEERARNQFDEDEGTDDKDEDTDDEEEGNRRDTLGRGKERRLANQNTDEQRRSRDRQREAEN
jgi:hypothetical protein